MRGFDTQPARLRARARTFVEVPQRTVTLWRALDITPYCQVRSIIILLLIHDKDNVYRLTINHIITSHNLILFSQI